MINLLPASEKKELELLRQKNLVVVLAVIAAIALVCLCLVLFSLKLYVIEEVAAQKTALAGTDRYRQSSQAASLEQAIRLYNGQIASISRFYQGHVKITEVLQTLLAAARPGGVKLTAVDVSKNGQTGGMVVLLSGTSDTRDNLIAFKESLKGSPGIQNVHFPAESWVKPSDVDFSATIEINLPIKTNASQE